ncbi:MAG: DNA (cytosine-5-)-methyltransferase [Omnitrophica WOR_2 bacterium GWA2_47_8]|nr:MAG: DNA (cytosine-5-)-methyltransferase [Omnitrophica WOR_2 bacterium GWA2_47_8]
MEKLNVVSIYSGAGGIDIGFKDAGFEILYSTDFSSEACKTLELNNASEVVECKDIREISFRDIKKKLRINAVDCFVGGPPCPAYSKSRFYLKEKKRALNDENAFTLRKYFKAVEELQPKVYFFENVHGFVYKPHNDAFDFLKNESRRLGYKIFHKVVNAANYGVPQTRERFICVGVKSNLPDFNFPRETHYDPLKQDLFAAGLKPWVTCQDAIGDIDYDLPEDKKLQAGSKDKDLLTEVPPGDNYLYFTAKRGHPNPKFMWRSRYWSFLLKLSPDRPSWTIQASHSNNMGPFHWKNRFLRIQEIKRLQTFDDDYALCGDFKSQWRQMGNAVPPLLAKCFAHAIKEQIFPSFTPNSKKSYQERQLVLSAS